MLYTVLVTIETKVYLFEMEQRKAATSHASFALPHFVATVVQFVLISREQISAAQLYRIT